MKKFFILIVAVSVVGIAISAETGVSRGKKSAPPKESSAPVEKKESKPAKPADLQGQIAALIKQLGDPTWQVREDATLKLIEIGRPARKALHEAKKSADAEISARARRAYDKIPWAVEPGDSPEVAELMKNYQTLQDDEREMVLARLVLMGRFKAIPPLLRIVENEGDELATQAALFVQGMSFGSSAAYVRAFPFEDERAHSYWLRGWAWRLHEPKQARVWLEKSLALQEKAQVTGSLKEIREWQILNSLGLLAELGAGDAVTAMLPKFESLYSNDARILYLRAKVATIKGNQGEVEKFTKEALALPPPQSPESMEAHTTAAQFLHTHKWHDWERVEWHAILAQNPPPRAKVIAHTSLAWLAAQDAQFTEAAEHYFAAGELAEDEQTGFSAARAKAWQAEGYWNRARAMMTKGETARLEETFKEMLRFSPAHPDGVGELARLYATNGRADEAQKLLAEAVVEMRTRFESGGGEDDEGNPLNQMEEATYHNNLAWTYVVANLHIPEALEEATKAVAAAPYEVAFLDTLAEAYFRSGQKQKAIERGKFALSLEPDNDYIKRQIKRFEAKEKSEPVPLQR